MKTVLISKSEMINTNKVKKNVKRISVSLVSLAMCMALLSCGNSNAVNSVDETTVAETTTLVETNKTETSGEKKLGNGGPQGRGGMGAGASFLDDTAKANLEKASNEVKDKYKEFTYTDDETGLSIDYGLFIPESYGRSNKVYPLIMFVGDATTTGNTITQILENCIGSVIWATAEEQKKHECFVLVPTFNEKLIDDSNGNSTISNYMDVIVRMIEKITNDYDIHKDKIYSTGQSMGCMTSLYLTANNPDLFAATLLVDGQWEISQIQGIKDRKFIYFAAEGDKKALEGQTNVKNYLKENNVEYAEVYDVDAKDSAENLNKIADELFSKGLDKNFITWKLNSTYVNGESNGSMAGEHMTSFYYGYNIERVRDWLFEQSKTRTKLKEEKATNNTSNTNNVNDMNSANEINKANEVNIVNNVNNMDDINKTNDNLKLLIDDVEVNVEWEDNDSVNAIKELAKNGGLTIDTHQYGGFEQVGEIGQSIVSNNVQMTTKPGDIVLYADSNIVVFYGSNSWSYTKLGRIVGKTDDELKNLLSKSNVVLKIN